MAVAERAATVRELRSAILTVTSVLALAYVMNLSGQAATIGHFVAAAGAGPAFLSSVLGWLGPFRIRSAWVTADHSQVSATDPLGEPMPDPHPGQVVWGDQKYSRRVGLWPLQLICHRS